MTQRKIIPKAAAIAKLTALLEGGLVNILEGRRDYLTGETIFDLQAILAYVKATPAPKGRRRPTSRKE